MGNLLGAPVLDKDTHVGVTSSGAEYGVSSMQGWRVHMEDAHITETLIYAADVVNGAVADNAVEQRDKNVTRTTAPWFEPEETLMMPSRKWLARFVMSSVRSADLRAGARPAA